MSHVTVLRLKVDFLHKESSFVTWLYEWTHKMNLISFGQLIKVYREHRNISQEKLSEEIDGDINRSVIAHLEQGIRLPKPDQVKSICLKLDIPLPMWLHFAGVTSQRRLDFEGVLKELVGETLEVGNHDGQAIMALDELIVSLFSNIPSHHQKHDIFNSVLVFYNKGPISLSFFDKYFKRSAFSDMDSFQKAVEAYQIDAIRIYPTFEDAFMSMSSSSDISCILSQISKKDTTSYGDRTEWGCIQNIEDKLLPDLGYISAKQVRQEVTERKWLIEQLEILAGKDDKYLKGLTIKKKNKIDAYLRKFDSVFSHGINSSLFVFDKDELSREAARLAPLQEDGRLIQMERTQKIALKNLSNYLAADYMDVYIATSMRSEADYISVNSFVKSLFDTPRIRELKLRYFNPTQSWIDDRVAKGLVEALMLKRASMTIYMAQKSDTFGKDSEASVALGQGKPVIVYVPKLVIEGKERIDVEEFFKRSRGQLAELYHGLPAEESGEDDEINDTIDDEALISTILNSKISAVDDICICEAVRSVWADFDLYNEVHRVPDELKENYRAWLDKVIVDSQINTIDLTIREHLVKVLIATSINFERRAKVFREVHPLALQVILSSGVLNGILVTRTVGQCAKIVEDIVKNEFSLVMNRDEDNYRVVEENTGSTIRVISRHMLLRNAFQSYYKGK